jgi:hypothetical protein
MIEQTHLNKRQLSGLTPDDEDRKNIVELIKTYDMAFPYPHPESLQLAIEDALKDVDRDVSSVHTSKGGMVKAMSLPQPFVFKLKKAYPLIFKDKGQFDWFMKNFPAFNLMNYKG